MQANVELDRLIEALRGKSVALVGNARGLLSRHHGTSIDSHDLVFRLNRGLHAPITSHGARTDVYAFSAYRHVRDLITPAVGSHRLHLSTRYRGEAPDDLKLAFYPEEWWQGLNDTLTSRPSAGAMALDILARASPAAVSIYGFDGYKTGTLDGRRHVGPHNYEAETQWIEGLIASRNWTMLRDDAGAPTAPRLRIALGGDHSTYHCGSAAVVQVMRHICAEHGEIVSDSSPHDVFVMNGEGSMHHNSRGFVSKMTALRAAQERGARTFLINSVWQENSSEFDDVLHRLEGVVVRGRRSARDLFSRHKIRPHVAPDLAYWAPIPPRPSKSVAGEVIVTDVYSRDLGGFVWPPTDFWPGATRVYMRDWIWSDLVSSLSTCSVFITGRHHGVYAACKARKPFVVFAGNTHKIEDLFTSAKVGIPICRSLKEARKALIWAERRPDVYTELFDWLEAQAVPTLPLQAS